MWRRFLSCKCNRVILWVDLGSYHRQDVESCCLGLLFVTHRWSYGVDRAL